VKRNEGDFSGGGQITGKAKKIGEEGTGKRRTQREAPKSIVRHGARGNRPTGLTSLPLGPGKGEKRPQT